MEQRKESNRALVLLCLLAAMAVTTGCGSSTETMPKATGVVLSASTPTAGVNTCATCHPQQTAAWMTSRHANAEGGLYSQGTPSTLKASCNWRCHDPLGDSNNIALVSSMGMTARPVIGCESCHGPGSLHADAGGVGPISLISNTTGSILGTGPTVTVSGQFVMCTACHQLLDDAGALKSNPQHSPNTGRMITDTHYAQPPYSALPGSWAAADGRNLNFETPGNILVLGYWMDYADERVCANCHNPHGTADINREWAQSAHADRYSGKTGYYSAAWSQYNWACDGTLAEGCGTSSGKPRGFTACQRCHTTTGFIKYADAVRTGDAATADTIRKGNINIILSSGVTDTSLNWKPQMLECNGCHTDNKGTLRNPGAVKANYDLDATATVKRSLSSFTYPDLGASNVCMLCHVGRNNGQSLKGINDPALVSSGTITTTDFSKFSFTNVHYLTAGATIFTTSGYEFDGLAYNNLDAYLHDKIGTSAAPNTGKGGPCVGCHMSRPNENGNHLFLPVSRDDTGVTGIASEVCFKCHGPSSSMILDMVTEQRELYHESLAALNLALERRGYYFRDFSPYFFQLRTNSTMASGPTAVLTDPTTVQLAATAGIVGGGTSPDWFKFDADGTWYKISAVASATDLTLAIPYAGTVTNGPYSIIRSGTGANVANFRTIASWYYPSQVPDTDTTGVVSAKNNQGAALNFNMLDHDPGGYVHNRMYVKRLMYDSIDWLDDNQMNYSVGATLNALDVTTYTWKTGAMRYLLPNGPIGIEAERP
jgi:hypothetical protein